MNNERREAEREYKNIMRRMNETREREYMKKIA